MLRAVSLLLLANIATLRTILRLLLVISAVLRMIPRLSLVKTLFCRANSLVLLVKMEGVPHAVALGVEILLVILVWRYFYGHIFHNFQAEAV